jgi:DNA-binding NtrC family response regulator
MHAGGFREDLWFRLNVFRIDVPPLRDRREDVLPLARALLDRLGVELGRRNVTLTPAAEARLLAYGFPGNVRELRNVLERALVVEGGAALELDLLERGPSVPKPDGDDFRVAGAPITMAELERRYVRHVLDALGGRRMEAAEALGLSYPTFLKRLDPDRRNGDD